LYVFVSPRNVVTPEEWQIMPVTFVYTAVGFKYIRYFFIPFGKGIRHTAAVATTIAPVAVKAIPALRY
jgi:hypothetical protein